MKRFLLLLVVLVVAGLGALAMTFTAQRLTVAENPTIQIPAARPPDGMKLAAILAGKVFSEEAFAYRGGSFTKEIVFSMGSIMIQHPKGILLVDAGFGRNVDAHFRTVPLLLRATSRYAAPEATIADQLRRAGIPLKDITAVVLTHAHWDHVSGLEDLPAVPVWITQQEFDLVQQGDDLSALARQLGTDNYRVYRFEGGPYLGFDRSHDVFGDGSVVIVPASGHTPGSIIVFVTLPSGQRYALVGDLVWLREGIALPAERPWLTRQLVDADEQKIRELIVRMHEIAAAIPGLTIVPAHDRRVWEQLPGLPQPASR